jgi:hypothetical protein
MRRILEFAEMAESRKNLFGFAERIDQAVDIVPVVVERDRRA